MTRCAPVSPPQRYESARMKRRKGVNFFALGEFR
jgi:hypothetical protein